MRRLALVLLVAACPAKKPPDYAQQQSGIPAGVGCPRASDVYLAQFVRPDTFSAQPAPGGFTGWTLPLAMVNEKAPEGTPAFRTLDQAAATELGIPAAPPAVWLMLPNGLCKATIGSFYSAVVDGSQTRGISLAGCAAPKDGEDEISIGLVSAEPPTQCVPMAPALAGARMGTEDQNGAWTPPTTPGTPIPPAFAQHHAAWTAAHPCTAPACELLWSVGKVEHRGTLVAYSGAINAAQTNSSRDACTWSYEATSGAYAVEADGSLKDLSNGKHLSIAASLGDQAGPKVLLLDGPGQYATYDVGTGTATLGRSLEWFAPDPADLAAVDRLGPTCPQK